MKILFVHQNFPGQYKHLVPALIAQGHEVWALGMTERVSMAGLHYGRYASKRGSTKGIHPWVVDFEAKVIRGEACALAAQRLKDGGFTPDLICAHPGWGEALLLREVWPSVPQLHFVEFFYGATGRDVGFDLEFGDVDFAARCRIEIKNTNNILNLRLMDRGISPTAWQRSTVPQEFQSKIEVIHDGIDTKQLVPDPAARLQLVDEAGQTLDLSRQDEVVTFVNRNLEPCRGYHTFMRALPDLLRRRPHAHVLLIGGDGVSYGSAPKQGSWKQVFLDEVKDDLDLSRVHFLGRVPYATYLTAIRISRAHVYLTYPFVLSWSLLEAMSMGAPIVASSTAPVTEVIEHDINGVLVDFFDVSAWTSAIAALLEDPARAQQLGLKARETVVSQYDLQSVCLPQQLALVQAMLGAS
jgi:glycosyltransferase involved in cell wall biosynthesis